MGLLWVGYSLALGLEVLRIRNGHGVAETKVMVVVRKGMNGQGFYDTHGGTE